MSTQRFFILLITSNIIIQSTVNAFMYNNTSHDIKNIESYENSQKDSALTRDNDLFSLLYEISTKLEKQNELLSNRFSKSNTDSQVPEIETESTEALTPKDHKKIDQIKYSLLDDMYNPDMNFASFINDPRLKSLSESDKDDVMNELTRRINNSEIDKETFLSEYKP